MNVSVHNFDRLGELEWNVVGMAQTDGPRSLNPEGFFARLSRELFGLPVPRILADEKLEALRRFAVRAWHFDLIRTRHLREFLTAGFSPSNARQILVYVTTYRGFTPSVQDWVV